MNLSTIWKRVKAIIDAAGRAASIYTLVTFFGLAVVPTLITPSPTFQAVFYVFGFFGAILAYVLTPFLYKTAGINVRKRMVRLYCAGIAIGIVILGAIMTALDPRVAMRSHLVESVREQLTLFAWWTNCAVGLCAFVILYCLIATFILAQK
jgi:hypothetical protein